MPATSLARIERSTLTWRELLATARRHFLRDGYHGARLVARVSDEATQRLWDTLSELPTSRQRRMLGQLLVVAGRSRVGS